MTEQNPYDDSGDDSGTTGENAHIQPKGAPASASDPQTGAAGQTHEDDQDQTQEAIIARLEAELTGMKDRWMRAEAEMQNLRARAKRELEEARQYTIQKFARDVVEAAENLQRGIASLPPTQEGEGGLVSKLREGFEGTERSFLAILERNGITRQDPEGHAFDADKHQAMQEQDSPDHAPGHVVQAWTPTWLLNNRLLKPAMVVVASQNSTGKKPQ